MGNECTRKAITFVRRREFVKKGRDGSTAGEGFLPTEFRSARSWIVVAYIERRCGLCISPMRTSGREDLRFPSRGTCYVVHMKKLERSKRPGERYTLR